MTTVATCGKHLAVAVLAQGATKNPVLVSALTANGVHKCEMPNHNRRGETCTSWAWYLVSTRGGEPSCKWCGSTEMLTGINAVWACPEHLGAAMRDAFEPVKKHTALLDGLMGEPGYILKETT